MRIWADSLEEADALALAGIPNLVDWALFFSALATACVWVPSKRWSAGDLEFANAFALVLVPHLGRWATNDLLAFALTSIRVEILAFWAKTVRAVALASKAVPNLIRRAALSDNAIASASV